MAQWKLMIQELRSYNSKVNGLLIVQLLVIPPPRFSLEKLRDVTSSETPACLLKLD